MSHSAVTDLERRLEELEKENAALRQAALEAQARELDLMAILGNTPAPIYLKDAALRYLLVNRKYEDLARVSVHALRGLTDYDIFPKPIANLFREQDQEVVRLGHPHEFEETIPLPDGEFTFITIKFPVYDAEGHLRAVGGFCTDITARKKGEREREALIEQLQSARNEVATLRRILPICSCCKQVRDDRGYWNQIDSYLRDHADLEFSHSVCPTCEEKMYGSEQWFRNRQP